MTTKVSSAMQDLTDDYAFSGTVSGAGAPSHRNDIINGGLVVNQENETAPADDAYTIGDLFLHVGEGTPVMSLETDGPQGTRPWQKMVLDANALGGLVYFLSNDDVQDYIANGKMSFGVQLRTVTGALITNARIGLLKWNSTADTITSDVVGTWASDGTDPTLATNWTYENTPANLALTNAWQRFTVEDITVDSDATNLAVFIWTDDGTITASDVIGFSEWQMNPGATVNDFSSPDTASVRAKVGYYFEKYDYTSTAGEAIIGGGYQYNTTLHIFSYRYPEKRIAPTVTHSAGATFKVRFQGNGEQILSSIDNNTTPTKYGTGIGAYTSAVGTAGDSIMLSRDASDTTWIQVDARF